MVKFSVDLNKLVFVMAYAIKNNKHKSRLGSFMDTSNVYAQTYFDNGERNGVAFYITIHDQKQ